MKCYLLKNVVDDVSIGSKHPQIQTTIGNFHVDAPNYIGNFFLKDVDVTPQLPEFQLWKSAKQTDLISGVSGLDKLIGSKLKNIIEAHTYNKSHVQFFNCVVHHKGIVNNDYWILHPSGTSDSELIDMDRSEIWEYQTLSSKEAIEQRYFKDIAALLSEKRAVYPRSIRFKHCVLKETTLDFFVLTYPGLWYVVSEKLKNAIEAAECTGILFTDLNVFP